MSGKRLQPPALAVWMLRHLGPRNAREAITGDLFERFSEGRSTVWFWREVLIAIVVEALGQCRARRVEFCLALAGAAVYVLSWPRIFRNRAFEQVWRWGVGLDWPLSAIYDIGLRVVLGMLMVLLIVIPFLLVTRTFSRRNVFRTLCISFALLATGALESMWLPHFFLALLVSTWMSRPLAGKRIAG